MELFSLLAKLTLDASDYNKELDEAQKAANSFESPDEQKLELDTSDYDQGIGDSESLSTGFTSNVGSAFEQLKSVIVGTGIAGAVLGIVNGLKEAVNLTAETADSIDKGSKRLGISTEKYQAWDHALRQSGASITDLQKGVLLFNKAIEGEATEDVAAAFEKLKLDPKDFKDSEQLIETTLTKLAELPNDAERMNLVTALFGRGGTSLNALLDEGTEGVKQLLSEAGDLGLIMSEDEIKNAVQYGDAVANLNAELDAIKTAFVQDIIPVLTDATEWLTSLLQTFNPRSRENELSKTFEDINNKTATSLTQIKENKEEAQALIDKLSAMGDYWTLDEDEQAKYNALVEELKDLYPELNKILDENKNAIYDNRDAILANINAWTKLEQQRLLDENIAEKKAAVADKYAKALDKEIEAEVKEAEAEGKRATAIDQVNEAIGKNEELRNAVLGAYGTTEVTNENADDILSFIRENGFQTANMTALDDYVALNTEAAKLRDEATKMEVEADEAQKHLTDYANALAKKLGVTTTETQQVINKVQELKQELASMPTGIRVTMEQPRAYTRAIGDSYIPYDNFPALLHRGERVMTATEARHERQGVGVDLSGLEDRIISSIKEGMRDVEVNSYLDGQAITDRVSKNLATQLADRRYV